MRTRQIIAAVMGLLVCSQMALAQAKIDRVAEELEKKGVEYDKVVNRDPKTKKVIRTVKSYEFRSKDGKYAQKLMNAFADEAENATTEISEKGGREQTLIFDDGECHMIYTLEVSKQEPDPKVELTIIVSYGKSKFFMLPGLSATLSSTLGDIDMSEIERFLEK
ncbi:MAG: DUF5024 domain-containing protein [Prevotella sp.]|nr:DUF5024 domain-containing protein [Prevotella sp.]